jgi:hypothetical protein
VTGGTRQLLRRIVARVTEAHSISRRLVGCTRKPAERMARATRPNALLIYFRIRRVTAKTRYVRVRSRRNR